MFIFETSWEVCNRVGGIYAVLSTRAASMRRQYGDNVIFIGPDVWSTESPSPYFTEDAEAIPGFQQIAMTKGLYVRVGRWSIPGNPRVVLVDYKPAMNHLNDLYAHAWERWHVSSLEAYGDYGESAAFGYVAGCCIADLYDMLQLQQEPVCAHFNEWMTAFGLLYVKENLPQVATLFTTHATGIGRSIAGNDKPLYGQLSNYNGNQMAYELNMVSKHAVEKTAAQEADCFTTVSDITNQECRQLLEKGADVVTPNGFEDDFVPKGPKFTAQRRLARQRLMQVAQALQSDKIKDNALFVGISGRYEFKNKGIDMFIDVLQRLSQSDELKRQIVAFIMVPGWIDGPNELVQHALKHNQSCVGQLSTHRLHQPDTDRLLDSLYWHALTNQPDNRVRVVLVPSYLNGNDGIFNCSYYDLLIGLDLTIFPSYYEPWGYTPLESVAFAVPTITTSLAGFGVWARKFSTDVTQGVGVINRSDYNYTDCVNQIAQMVLRYAALSAPNVQAARKTARQIAQQALWKHFFKYYRQAYQTALNKAAERTKPA